MELCIFDMRMRCNLYIACKLYHQAMVNLSEQELLENSSLRITVVIYLKQKMNEAQVGVLMPWFETGDTVPYSGVMSWRNELALRFLKATNGKWLNERKKTKRLHK